MCARFRPGVALAVLLQLLLVAAPSSALVLCVSDDGCTAVEIALPGSVNCIEKDCDDEHRQAADEDHACRDFAYVAAAPAKAQTVGLTQPLLALASTLPALVAVPVPHELTRSDARLASPTGRGLRSTVLQL